MSLKNWLLLALLSILWGTSFFFYEKLLLYVSPIQVVIIRLCLGALFLSSYCLLMKLRLPRSLSDWIIIFIMAMLINTLPFTLFAYAQTYINGSLAAILNSNTAFFGMLVAVIFIKDEKFSLLKLVGLVIGLMGVIIAIGIEHVFELNAKNIGQWLVVVATLSYAVAGTFSRIKMSHLSGTAISCTMLLCSSFQILVIGFLTGSISKLPIQTETLLYGAGIGLFCTGLAYLIYLKLIQSAGASNTSLVTLLIPVVAIIFNSFTLNESLKPNEVIGFIIILIGLLLLNGKFSYFKKNTSTSIQ